MTKLPTLVALQVVTLPLPRLALALKGPPRVITGYAGCGLVVASLICSRVKDLLFFFGLAIGIAAILLSCIRVRARMREIPSTEVLITIE